MLKSYIRYIELNLLLELFSFGFSLFFFGYWDVLDIYVTHVLFLLDSTGLESP
jgi:hypothetical protein